MDITKGKNKEQLADELNKANLQITDLIYANAKLKNQVNKLMRVIEFLTKGE